MMKQFFGICAPLALTAGLGGGAHAAVVPAVPVPPGAGDMPVLGDPWSGLSGSGLPAAWFPGDGPTGSGLSGNGPAPGQGLPVARAPLPLPHQVRIEQSFTIRITPGPARPMPPPLVEELEQSRPLTHFAERDMGRCVAMGAIAGVQSSEGNRLLLFMRDQRIVSALLEKTCRAQDFYLGFYVTGNHDGLICVDRDRLQARSGANCKVKRLRALVEMPVRRQP